MHAHGSRSMLCRRNVTPSIILFLLLVVTVCGLTAGTVQSFAKEERRGASSPQSPTGIPGPIGQDIEKEFNDDDLKVKEEKPRGKWGFATVLDRSQAENDSIPVAVVGIQSLSGGGKHSGITKIKRIELKNRSRKIVNSVQLRWTLTPLDAPEKVLSEGATQFANIWVEANSSKVIEIPTLYPALLLNSLAKDGELNGRFKLTIGVQEARFADGSFWRRQEPAASLRFLDSYRALESGFPSLASLAPGLIPPRAGTSVGNGRSNQRPPEFANQTAEDTRKDCNDDDLKVKDQKPRGKWGTGLVPDMAQFNDASVPAVVGAIQSLAGRGVYAGVIKVKRLEIKNRSPKAVNSVQLRWEIVSLDDPAKVLLEGTLPFVNFLAEADSSKVIEIPTIYPALLFNPLAKGGELNGRFQLTIGVQEARFADGSFWRRQGPVVSLNLLYYEQPAAERFPSLASISPIFPPPRVDPGGTRGIFRPCEAKPRSSASAFSSMAYQETTCHDDMSTFIDLDTLYQSCGTPTRGAACYQNCKGGPCNVDVVPGGKCSPTPTPKPEPAAASTS